MFKGFTNEALTSTTISNITASTNCLLTVPLYTLGSDWKYNVVKVVESRSKKDNRLTTIVFWDDGSKTMVKCREGEVEDRYVAFCSAVAKKMYGSKLHSIVRQYFPKEDE